MWAVEKRLRSLVQIPPPLRSGVHVGAGESLSATGAQAGVQSIATISSAPSAAKSLEGAVQGLTLNRQRFDAGAPSQAAPTRRLTSVILSRDDDALDSLAIGTLKLDSPRQPVRVTDTTSFAVTSDKASDPTSRAGRAAAVPSLGGSQTLVKASLQPNMELKSASILKLVANDKLRKSREELVDEYKRARRTELEAMLRTMVHK